MQKLDDSTRRELQFTVFIGSEGAMNQRGPGFNREYGPAGTSNIRLR